MKKIDVAIVGAGPAGSVCAYHLASAGANVMLFDRASFPRDKPCGGGLTGRALRELPFDVEDVVEARVDEFEMRLRYGSMYRRKANRTLVTMTQRSRLDALLASRAAAAGAEFRDGTTIRGIEEQAIGDFVLVCNGERVRAATVIGADGANGTSAAQLGLVDDRTQGIAMEGNLRHTQIRADRYAARAVIELATVPGGYGWVFPKADHVNFGVGGWGTAGPDLRSHLGRLCRMHGTELSALENVRGHRLPLRKQGAPLARGRAALIGDAAGLIDPVSGDGMFECFVSARLSSAAVCAVLGGESDDLTPYSAELEARLGRNARASWAAKHAFDRFPRTAFTLTRPRFVWSIIEQLIHGDIEHPGASSGPARIALKGLKTVARAARVNPGVST